ncbi:hypothetical protein HY407_03905 [Candidatus Gottesmanbacteria bacterium]|nr:hypothetical protein [Candidatus Gottesmanbacteria bacterium]
MTVIGITGTDGKTTTTELVYHILKTAGKKVSMISTVRAVINGKEYDTGFHITTPNSSILQRFFSLAKKGHTEYMVLEVTSHALDQQRVRGIKFDIGVITNVSHEHLDYHKSFKNYLYTKAKLVTRAKNAILNVDDTNFTFLSEKAQGKIYTFGIEKSAETCPQNTNYESTLIGKFNQYNILASVAVARILKIDDSTIRTALKTFPGVKGRLEEIKNNKEFRIFIDFAHKINALENALKTVRLLTDKRVIVVFGSAGLRDHLKRPIMGKVAGKIANFTILTAEDPRTEDVRDIIGQIASGCIIQGAKEVKKKFDLKNLQYPGHYFWRIPDRQEAINFAIKNLAKSGDIVLVTGKGHEKSMCYGTTEYPWDEESAIRKALDDKIKQSKSI